MADGTPGAGDATAALRLARVSMAIAVLALLLGPLVGFAAGRAFSSQGAQGPVGPTGSAGPTGPTGPAGTDDELAGEVARLQSTVNFQQAQIDVLTECINDYMKTVGDAGGGRYRYTFC